jgi:3D (Asp-Asp-Asp) domain-containing protein
VIKGVTPNWIRRSTAPLVGASLCVGCATAGSTWIAQTDPGGGEEWGDQPASPATGPSARPPSPALGVRARSIGEPPPVTDESAPGGGYSSTRTASGRANPGPTGGRSLGPFRNTYYDFPSERDFEGANVELKNGRCKTVATVARGFFEAVCVQGSGTLKQGGTVSFAKRDCECADVCPRTGQRICFDLLDGSRFPWGRGATGHPITPLLSVAVDSNVIPLGTAIYVPEYDGLPRDADRTSFHDGCFVAHDRGMKVQGKQIDVFTGHQSVTKLWNKLMPSNKGVTVILDSPRCARAAETGATE